MDKVYLVIVAGIIAVISLIPSAKKELEELPMHTQYTELEEAFLDAAKAAQQEAMKLLPQEKQNEEFWQEKRRLISELEQQGFYYDAADSRRDAVYQVAKWLRSQPLHEGESQEERDEYVAALFEVEAQLQGMAQSTSKSRINSKMSVEDRTSKLNKQYQQFMRSKARFEDALAVVSGW